MGDMQGCPRIREAFRGMFYPIIFYLLKVYAIGRKIGERGEWSADFGDYADCL